MFSDDQSPLQADLGNNSSSSISDAVLFKAQQVHLSSFNLMLYLFNEDS